MRSHPMVKRLLVLLSTTGLVGAAFLATTPGVVGFVANPPCTSANVTYSTTYAVASILQTVTFTASSTGCNQPAEYQFLFQAPGGTFVSKRAYSTTATYAWNTTGLQAGNWNFVIRARAAGSTVAYDTYFAGSFTLWVNYCQQIIITSDFSPGAPLGTPITFTAAPNPCAYEDVGFLLLVPGGTWRVMRPYSSTLTWTWDTRGYGPGLYQIEVWAREKGSRARYDVYGVVSVVLRPLVYKCQAAYLVATTPSPQPAGGLITFFGTGQGCDPPSLEFWMLAPGGAWKIVQPYQDAPPLSSSVSYIWDTTGLANGRYMIGVWARKSGSSSKYEAFANMTYFIGT